MCSCLLCVSHGRPGLQPRHVPWLGIEPEHFGSQAGAQSTEPHQPRLRFFLFVPSVDSFGHDMSWSSTDSCGDYMFLPGYGLHMNPPWSALSFTPVWSSTLARCWIFILFNEEPDSCPGCFSTCLRNIWSFSGDFVIVLSLGLRKAVTANQFIFPKYFFSYLITFTPLIPSIWVWG